MENTENAAADERKPVWTRKLDGEIVRLSPVAVRPLSFFAQEYVSRGGDPGTLHEEVIRPDDFDVAGFLALEPTPEEIERTFGLTPSTSD